MTSVWSRTKQRVAEASGMRNRVLGCVRVREGACDLVSGCIYHIYSTNPYKVPK